MDEFIRTTAEKLGLAPSAVKNATSALLLMIRERIGAAEFTRILGRLPNVAALLRDCANPTTPAAPARDRAVPQKDAAAGGSSAGTDSIGDRLQRASSLLSGAAARGSALKSILENAGIPGEKTASFIALLLDWIESAAGESAMGVLLGKIPELQKRTT